MREPSALSAMAQMIYQWIMSGSSGWRLTTLMFVTSLCLMLFFGGPMIAWLRQKRWRKDAETWTVREDTPDTHLVKQGTPSMGGIGLIGSALATYFAVASSLVVISYLSGLGRGHIPAVILFMLSLLPLTVGAHALLGFADDWSKATGRGGLRARAKFLAQLILAAGFLAACVCLLKPYYGEMGLISYSPEVTLSPLLFGVLLIIVVATCNAVNLTDGIDGLAAGLAIQSGLALSACEISYAGAGTFGTLGGALFCVSLAGACLGFLVYNKHPARVFMGDTGSLALGAGLGAGAILTREVFLLPFIGFIFYVEMFSVILQVAYFKWTKRRTGEGKRIFRRAPLHHHFELGGWSEWRVVATFWAINLMTTALGLFLWHQGVLPRWP